MFSKSKYNFEFQKNKIQHIFAREVKNIKKSCKWNVNFFHNNKDLVINDLLFLDSFKTI